MDIGKLPNQLLGQLLARIGPDVSGRVVVGPAVGQDAAVIDMGQRLLVAKSDPITFARAAGSLQRWREEVLNYCHFPLTNALVEGKHNRLKVLKRRAHGYRNDRTFLLRRRRMPLA